MMHLKVMKPTEILIDQPVLKINAEGMHGSFCLLPQHLDGVFVLTAGIFSFESATEQEIFLAIDEGILVKQSSEVWVSVRNAVQGDNLETLQQAVEAQFRHLDEREQQARQMLARLQTNFAREFMTLGGANETL